ncbi:EAL and modified HD-GYP domain-containing signal transduction protein [Aeromonas sp. BIGb0405]|uniref:EAL and HDOD domain-containing protein n=1 Tax=Aeromonas TaxID=642 RepID=UPI001CCA938C|nr:MULTISPECIES: EAL domain-containing protein [Aeromonas]MCS3454046.1 EAL and modified HD-GYP domain-containing signal transduction protein [Aeromonas sp. BIGb0405]UBO75668.1 EAL domain-containing protein [Aeromonas rivuli]
MYSYVARQPILDSKLRTHAYELLFRDSLDNVFPLISSQQATSRLVVEQFLQQNIDQLLGGRPCFINFSHDSLLDGLAECLPPEQVVIEILEDAMPDDALLAKVKQLNQLGYRLALDDFSMSSDWERFLPWIQIIKFDLRLSSLSQIDDFIRRHQHLALTYLAEKVESKQEFEQTQALGISLFQGFFFSRPEMVKRATMQPTQMVVIQLLNEVNQPEPNLDKIEQLLGQDVSLSLKLLRYVNNLKGRSKPIASFRQAAIYLGHAQLKRFVTLIAASSAGQGKSAELYQMSLIRARFCELLALAHAPAPQSQQAFMAGLFSLLDVLMEQSMGTLLGSVPITDEIRQALLTREGQLGFYLAFCEDYENANWPRVQMRTARLGLNEEKVSQLYLSATAWVNEQLSAMNRD